ncbi:hypothetical protein SLS62_009279 [Diatrype stigma]|uniref:Chromo domain-containing protein n=1 Tax=Diatrype stigma TaxID=117547 RepID=A0AAN9UG20_9PEZI
MSELDTSIMDRDGSDGGDEDDVSITSTIDEPEGDFDVEELLHERVNPNNPDEIQYLIKWEGYPYDQCTWEPRQHLGDGVFEGWEETKAEIRAGKRQAFDMRIYQEAIEKASQAKTQRHMRRNAKRKRLGLPLTEPLPPESVATSSVADDNSDSGEEAMEVDDIDPGHLPASSSQPGARSQTQKPIKQKMFHGIPALRPQYEGPAEPRKPSITTTKPQPKPLPKPPQEPISKPRPSTSSTITGYQGTARPPVSRKPSISINTNVPKQAPRKLPTPTARPSPNSAPPSAVAAPVRSSSLRAKFSGKKATRTRSEVQSKPIPNVFSEGKRRQPRKNLADAMSDPTKDPKQFYNMRLQNIARKKAIEMNDAAPQNIASIPAAFILNNDQNTPKPQQQNQTKIKPNLSPISSVQPTPIMQDTSVKSPDDTGETAPLKRTKKSVRFSDADELPPVSQGFDPVLDEHVVFDSPLASPEEPPATTISSKKKLSLAKYKGRPQMHTVSKTCIFGQNGSMEVQVQFTNVPRQGQQAISGFLQEEKLHFHRVCFSYDFERQRNFLYQEIYSSGILKAEVKESALALENVAEHMWRRSSGLYLANPEYSILVYPTKSEGWQGIINDQAQEDPTESTLRYKIFNAPYDVQYYPDNTELPVEISGGEGKSTLEKLVKLMMDLDFSTMTTHNSTDQDKQVFMLMFPPQDPLSRIITLWLRDTPKCSITSAEFPSWLQGLCQEKSHEWRYQKTHNSEYGFKEYAHKYGLTMERIDAFWKAWELLKKITEEYGDEETHANVRKVMWAPREINPNDEQSLVNWFFWWSTTSLDCYRRFYVLGSSVKNKATAYRMIRVPNYDPDQSLDPDELMEKHRLEREAEEQKVMALWDPQGVGNPPATTTSEGGSDAITKDQNVKSPPKTPADRHRNSFVSQSGLPFPSNLFASDRPEILKSWLIERQRNCKTHFSTPFWQPISWEDVAMADHFGDPTCEYANFTHWLSTCQRFRKAKNTWYGLFYTPNGKWDPTRPSHTYGRHPWIAVYRPVNPHQGTQEDYFATELFIWDLDVGKKKELSDMQLRLIDFVRRQAPKLVCPDYFLDRVWYSNRVSRDVSRQSHILDATCLQLEDMMDDARYWVPPFDGPIRTRGWREIAPSEVAHKVEQLNMAINQGGHQKPFPKHYSDAEEPPSFVWLPPRGTVKPFRCYNDLYEAAYRNRTEDEACREFRYQYRPTLEWYEEQKREGRHFSYVCVDAGDRILDRLHKLKHSKPK